MTGKNESAGQKTSQTEEAEEQFAFTTSERPKTDEHDSDSDSGAEELSKEKIDTEANEKDGSAKNESKQTRKPAAKRRSRKKKPLVSRPEACEECSFHVGFNPDDKEEVDRVLADYDPSIVIKGRAFFILTLENKKRRDEEKESIGEKLKSLKVRITNFRKTLRQIRNEEARRKIYVTAFKEDVTAGMLRESFQEFGPVEDVILRKSSTKNNKPYAFIKFETEEPVAKALEAEVNFDNEKVLIEKAITRPYYTHNETRRVTVMLTNFSEDLTSSDVQAEAQKHGKVQSFVFKKDHSIVRYDSSDSATSAISELNGKEMAGKKILAIYAPSPIISPRRGRGRGRARGRWRGRGRRRGEWKRNAEKTEEKLPENEEGGEK